MKKQDKSKARRIIQAEIKKAGLKMQLKTKEQEPQIVVKPLVSDEPSVSEPQVPFVDLPYNYQAPHTIATLVAATDDWAEEVLRRLATHEQELSQVSAEEFFV